MTQKLSALDQAQVDAIRARIIGHASGLLLDRRQYADLYQMGFTRDQISAALQFLYDSHEIRFDTCDGNVRITFALAGGAE